MVFNSSISLSSDGNPSPGGTLAGMQIKLAHQNDTKRENASWGRKICTPNIFVQNTYF